LFAREDAKQNVNIVGIQEKRVTNVQNLMEIIEFGNSVRVTGINFPARTKLQVLLVPILTHPVPMLSYRSILREKAKFMVRKYKNL